MVQYCTVQYSITAAYMTMSSIPLCLWSRFGHLGRREPFPFLWTQILKTPVTSSLLATLLVSRSPASPGFPDPRISSRSKSAREAGHPTYTEGSCGCGIRSVGILRTVWRSLTCGNSSSCSSAAYPTRSIPCSTLRGWMRHSRYYSS